jgi:hypothetical protein
MVLAASGLAAVLALFLLQRIVSADALLPVLVITFFLMACVAALFAWHDRGRRRRLTYWDVSGLLTLIGILLASAVEPDQLVRLVEAGPGAE